MLKRLQNRTGDKEHDIHDMEWVCVASFGMANAYRKGGDTHSNL
jgi:hypothetical protein